MKKIILALICCAFQARGEGLKLGVPEYGGTGCPADTAAVVLSPDEEELSVIFDAYVAEAGGDTRKKIDRKSCSLGIPVSVPQGFSLSIIQADYRGFSAVPYGGRTTFSVESFFAGQRGSKFTKNMMGPLNSDFNLKDEFGVTAMVWSACGAQVNLRLNTSILAMTNRSNEQTMIAVDSTDVSSKIVYHLKWKRCY